MVDKIHEMDIAPEEESRPDKPGAVRHALNKFIKISYGTVVEYYAIMRLLGYAFDPTYKKIYRKITDWRLRGDEMYHQARREVEYFGAKLQRDTGRLAKDVPLPYANELSEAVKATESAAGRVAAQDYVTNRLRVENLRSSRYLNYFEAAAFATWTTVNLLRDRRRLKENLGATVAAELGINPDQVTLRDIYHSKNPIVQSNIHRFTLQNAVRYVSDLLFGVNLVAGIVAKTGDITMERSVFNDRDAYDIVRGIVRRISDNNLSPLSTNGYTHDSIVEDLQVAIQRSRRDHQRPKVTVLQLNALGPILGKVADGIINHQFGVPETVYILGTIAKHPENVEAAQREFDNVASIGLRGISAWKRGNTVFPFAPDEVLKREGNPAAKPQDQGIPDKAIEAQAGEHVRKVLNRTGPLSPMDRANSTDTPSGLSV